MTRGDFSGTLKLNVSQEQDSNSVEGFKNTSNWVITVDVHLGPCKSKRDSIYMSLQAAPCLSKALVLVGVYTFKHGRRRGAIGTWRRGWCRFVARRSCFVTLVVDEGIQTP